MSRPSWKILNLLLTPLWLAGSLVLAADQPNVSGQAGFRQRIDAYESAVRSNTIRIMEAKTEDERALYRASVPDPRPCAEEVLGMLQAHPHAPDVADGINWLLTQCLHLPQGLAALDLVAQKYAALSGIAPALKRLEDIDPAQAAPVLRAVLAATAAPEEKAAAVYALGSQHFRAFESAGDDAIRETERANAAGLLQQVVTDFPQVKVQGFALADQASALLFEMENLSVGALAPEIEGKDDKDQAFKLSDYRGRAVVLVFWGDWCHGCHGLQPALADLAAAMQGRPITILGVNTDDPVTARKILATSPVPWRCWLDGSTSGAITTGWNLHHFPTLYVLDKDGRIIAKDPAITSLPPLLEKALAEPGS